MITELIQSGWQALLGGVGRPYLARTLTLLGQCVALAKLMDGAATKTCASGVPMEKPLVL